MGDIFTSAAIAWGVVALLFLITELMTGTLVVLHSSCSAQDSQDEAGSKEQCRCHYRPYWQSEPDNQGWRVWQGCHRWRRLEG